METLQIKKTDELFICEHHNIKYSAVFTTTLPDLFAVAKQTNIARYNDKQTASDPDYKKLFESITNTLYFLKINSSAVDITDEEIATSLIHKINFEFVKSKIKEFINSFYDNHPEYNHVCIIQTPEFSGKILVTG